MARCPDCNKFVSYSDDLPEPDVQCDVDDTGHVTGTVVIVAACAECGTELKEGSFDFDLTVDITKHTNRKAPCAECGQPYAAHYPRWPDEFPEALNCPTDPDPRAEYVDPAEHELECETDSEMTSRRQGRKTYYGHHTTIHISCACGFQADAEIDDEMLVGDMDELT